MLASVFPPLVLASVGQAQLIWAELISVGIKAQVALMRVRLQLLHPLTCWLSGGQAAVPSA